MNTLPLAPSPFAAWTRWVSPDVFDFWAAHLSPTLSWSRCLARVVAVRPEAKGTVTLELQPNRHFSGFRPGQHLNVSAEIGGRRVTRSYSLSDVPRADGRLAITVRQVEGGRLSTRLCAGTRIGDVLELGPAFGDLTWDEPPPTPWLLLAAGSGITPLMSLIRSARASGVNPDLTLLYWARTAEDLCFDAELRHWAAQDAGFRYQPIVTRDAQSPTAGTRPDAAQLCARVPDLATRRIYACGPAGFVESLRRSVAPLAQAFEAESFTPSAPDSSRPPTRVKVMLTRSARQIDVSTGQSLLEALESQGLAPAHGCRMGICNTCVCTKRSGTTRNRLSGERDAGAHPDLKICISEACDDLELDL